MLCKTFLFDIPTGVDLSNVRQIGIQIFYNGADDPFPEVEEVALMSRHDRWDTWSPPITGTEAP